VHRGALVAQSVTNRRAPSRMNDRVEEVVEVMLAERIDIRWQPDVEPQAEVAAQLVSVGGASRSTWAR
jgi:hypothetical protein